MNSNDFNPELAYNRRGPWDNTREFVKDLSFYALVHNLENDEVEFEFRLDYSSREDRSFIGRLTFWAITNGKSVETISAEVWEKIR